MLEPESRVNKAPEPGLFRRRAAPAARCPENRRVDQRNDFLPPSRTLPDHRSGRLRHPCCNSPPHCRSPHLIAMLIITDQASVLDAIRFQIEDGVGNSIDRCGPDGIDRFSLRALPGLQWGQPITGDGRSPADSSSDENTSELHSLMTISYAISCMTQNT